MQQRKGKRVVILDRGYTSYDCEREILAEAGCTVDIFEGERHDGIHSAGIDVYSAEPPPARLRPLLDHPRVISTGHYTFYSESAMIELQRRAARNLRDLLSGAVPEDCLNP